MRAIPLLATLHLRTRALLATPRLTTARARRATATAAILLGGIAVSVLIVATARSNPPVPLREVAAAVTTVTISPGSLAPSITAYGRIESSHVARLRTSIDAPIASVSAHEGDWVARGTVLLQIEPRQFQLARTEREAELAQAQSHLQMTLNEFVTARTMTVQHEELARIARAKLQRYNDLSAKGMVPLALLDEVREQASQHAIALADHAARLRDFPNRIREQEALVRRGRALLERAQLDLDETSVRAPFAGPVLAVHVATGDRSGAPVLVEMADANAIEVRAAVADRHIDALRTALDAAHPVTAHARIDGRDIALTLTHLADGIKRGEGATDAFFKLASASASTLVSAPTANARLPLGRVVDVTLTLPAAHAVVALPVQSIYEGERVYLVAHSRLVGVAVQRVGDYVTSDGRLQVLVRAKELTAGVDVITTQLPRAITGLLVAPVNHAADNSTQARPGPATGVGTAVAATAPAAAQAPSRGTSQPNG